MGMFSMSPAYRLLGGISEDLVGSEARILLAGFFEAMGTRTVYLPGPSSIAFVDLVEKATGMPLDVTSEREEALTPGDAVSACAARLISGQPFPGISRGISFGLDQLPTSPKNRWHLMLHRGPLPSLSITISDNSAFRPVAGWEKVLICKGAAHIVWNGKVYLGTRNNIYLLLKTRQLFPYSKASSTQGAIDGGLMLQKLCRNLALKDGQQEEMFRLRSWHWARKRFLRNFDQLLVQQVGTEELTQILSAMGTDLDTWLNVL